MLHIRTELFVWYKQQAASDPEWSARAAQVWSLTLKMLGEQSDPILSAKANETAHFLPFVLHMLEKYRARMELHNETEYRFLLAACQAAERFNEIIRNAGRIMTYEQRRDLFNAYLRYVSSWMRMGFELQPKHHLMFHLIARVEKLGNPRFYWTYRDESLNGVLIKVARSAHRGRFMETIHDKFAWIEALGVCQHMF